MHLNIPDSVITKGPSESRSSAVPRLLVDCDTFFPLFNTTHKETERPDLSEETKTLVHD